ncbi:MAG: Ycf66 family protein [Cyanobium sp.]
MLATFGGCLALVLGLSILALPLLIAELSRARDSLWGAVVLLLGLVLVTSAERLTGAPMLAVLCGGLLIGRLGVEVGQGRWRALSDEERDALLSPQRWNRSLDQLVASGVGLLESAAGLVAGLQAWQAERSQGRSHGKRWVRLEDRPQEPPEQTAAVEPASDEVPQPSGTVAGDPPPSDPQRPSSDRLPVAESTAAVTPAVPPIEPAAEVDGQDRDQPDPCVRIVSDFSEIEALVDAAAAVSPADPPADP